MTREEQELLTAYLVDAGDIDPEGDLEEQFQDWYQIREGSVSGETHYKAILDAARVRRRSYEEGGWTASPRPWPSWAGTSWQRLPDSTGSWTTSAGRMTDIRDPAEKSTGRPLAGADQAILCPEEWARSGGTSRFGAILAGERGHA